MLMGISKGSPRDLALETNPEEALEPAYQELQGNLASELLEDIKKYPSEF
jgi:restriction endonuclease Mrr